MRRLTADFIVHPSGNLVSGNTLLVAPDGTIAGLEPVVLDNSEYFQGVISPGFVNAHVHTELSHLYGKITPHKKLHGFITEFVLARKEHRNGISEAVAEACIRMWDQGIQAAGDICNTSDSFAAKLKSPIRFYNFCECFSIDPAFVEASFEQASQLATISRNNEFEASVVPHAPYSVPPELMDHIRIDAETGDRLWSIHNQETADENALFKDGTGSLADLFKQMGFSMNWIQPPGTSSLQYLSGMFPASGHLLLVHNTFTNQSDIRFLASKGLLERCWFCLCPKANLFIEDRLPNVPMLMHEGCKIVVGTDSLASNDNLSILEELIVLNERFPKIPVSSLLQWTTANGAAFFGWEDLGQFRTGCKPGVIHIPGANPDIIPRGSTAQRIA